MQGFQTPIREVTRWFQKSPGLVSRVNLLNHSQTLSGFRDSTIALPKNYTFVALSREVAIFFKHGLIKHLMQITFFKLNRIIPISGFLGAQREGVFSLDTANVEKGD